MFTELSLITKPKASHDKVYLIHQLEALPKGVLSAEEMELAHHHFTNLNKREIVFHRGKKLLVISQLKEEPVAYKNLENCRKAGDRSASLLNGSKVEEVVISGEDVTKEEILACIEGAILGNYQFLKYKNDQEKRNSLARIFVHGSLVNGEELKKLDVLCQGVSHCRNLINEPFCYLTADVFAQSVVELAQHCGAKVEVMNESKIASLKMGGLLAVNQGSTDPPTFTVMEWKPVKAVNKKPLIFVGKGVVYDSGGMNLKPGDSMLNMKDDMSGAAAVAGAIYSIAKAKLPVHVVGLMPATDNKIGPDAIVPGDVITMSDGTTVEVINTDAEGRLILADALAYAGKLNPELVIDLATLTGAAVRAIGKVGIVAMQSKAEEALEDLKRIGLQVYERIVEFPSWDEYGEMIKSDIADIKNLGPGEAGTITAGKFLEHFTSYPYIHLDIAGPAFIEKRDGYRAQGGTGVGVRLLFAFAENFVNCRK